MVEVVAVPGGKPDLDALVRDAGVEAAGKELAIRLRMQPTILMNGEYVAWPAVSWMIEFGGHEQVSQFRDDLTRWITQWAVDQNRAVAKGQD